MTARLDADAGSRLRKVYCLLRHLSVAVMYLFICSHVAYGLISTSSIDVHIVPENVAMTVGDEASGIF